MELSEGSLWSAVKSENQLVGFSIVLDETPQHRRLTVIIGRYCWVFKLTVESDTIIECPNVQMENNRKMYLP